MKGKLASLATFVLVAYVAAAGFFNWRPVGPPVRYVWYQVVGRAKQAAAPAPASGPTRGGLPEAHACRENLRKIENAKAAIRARGNTRATGGVSWAEIMKEIPGARGSSLTCPVGGEYSLGSQTTAARCSIGGNGTVGEGDDHIIKSY